jgi:hypothetical protein
LYSETLSQKKKGGKTRESRKGESRREWEEGRKEGGRRKERRKEGRKDGGREGEKEGRREGRKEGRREGKKEKEWADCPATEEEPWPKDKNVERCEHENARS